MQGTEAFLSMVAQADPDQYPIKVEALVEWFKAEWVTQEEPPRLGSQEASEQATLMERNRRWAASAFKRMEPEMQSRLVAAATEVFGQSEARSLLQTLRGR